METIGSKHIDNVDHSDSKQIDYAESEQFPWQPRSSCIDSYIDETLVIPRH